jgi:hypothetical protein
MDNTIDLIIFSPGSDIEYALQLRDRIQQIAENSDLSIKTQTWKDGDFFSDSNKYLLNECIRKMHKFDGAVLILGPQPTNNPFKHSSVLKNIGQILVHLWDWTHARMFARNVAPNVLIEIGAAMARYGRNRVFLLMPKSESVKIPTYFEENNAIFLKYDDQNSSHSEAMNDPASNIVTHLESLGTSAFFSDLPSFGLAHGYFNNYVRQTHRRITDGQEVEINNESKIYSDINFVMVVPEDSVYTRDDVSEFMSRLSLPKGEVQAGDRPLTFRCLPSSIENDTLNIVEVPSNLIPSEHAILKIDALWAGEQDPDFQNDLIQREMRNYVRYLDVLRQAHDDSMDDASEKLGPNLFQWVYVANLDSVTISRLESEVEARDGR